LDLHVYDPRGEHISFKNRQSTLGGNLYADSQYRPNSVEIVSFNSNNSSSIVTGTFSVKVVYHSCITRCWEPIDFQVAILKAPNDDWEYYKKRIWAPDRDYYYDIATFTVSLTTTLKTTTISTTKPPTTETRDPPTTLPTQSRKSTLSPMTTFFFIDKNNKLKIKTKSTLSTTTRPATTTTSRTTLPATDFH
jgi:hypothetical protein